MVLHVRNHAGPTGANSLIPSDDALEMSFRVSYGLSCCILALIIIGPCVGGITPLAGWLRGSPPNHVFYDVVYVLENKEKQHKTLPKQAIPCAITVISMTTEKIL